MRRGLVVGVVVGVMSVVAFGACSSGHGASSASRSTTTVAPAVARDAACGSLSVADATALFGEPAVSVDVRTPALAAASCFYGTNGASGQLLQFRIYASESYYSRAEHADAQDVSGIGDRAFVSRAGPSGLVDCQFVKQGRVYSLAYSNTTGNAPARADALVTLARTIAGRV